LHFKLDESYQRLTKLAQDKPILIAEFGCDIHNRYLNCGSWAKAAFEELFSEKWPRIVGFCWWNEAWQNDDVKKHDSDLIVLHDVDLTKVFRDELAAHRDKIQQSPVIAP